MPIGGIRYLGLPKYDYVRLQVQVFYSSSCVMPARVGNDSPPFFSVLHTVYDFIWCSFSVHLARPLKCFTPLARPHQGAYNQQEGPLGHASASRCFLTKMWHLGVNSLTSLVPRLYLLGQSSWGARPWSR